MSKKKSPRPAQTNTPPANEDLKSGPEDEHSETDPNPGDAFSPKPGRQFEVAPPVTGDSPHESLRLRPVFPATSLNELFLLLEGRSVLAVDSSSLGSDHCFLVNCGYAAVTFSATEGRQLRATEKGLEHFCRAFNASTFEEAKRASPYPLPSLRSVTVVR